MAQWHVNCGGQNYGPIDEETLRTWVREGRVRPTDPVWTGGMATWQQAQSVPGLLAAPGAPLDQLASAVQPPQAPYAPPASGYPQQPAYGYPTQPQGQYVQPHRGTVILILGILSWVVCAVLGLVAWIMGSGDLRKMDMGQMDPSGRSMTRAGQIIGMISVILSAVFIVIMIIAAISEA